MRLYKKLVYVGSIWSLLQYSILTISGIALYSMLYPMKRVLDSVPLDGVSLIYSSIHLLFLFGITGVVTCIIIIFSVKKIKKVDSIRKKLSKILIITGIVLFVLQIIQFPLVVDMLADKGMTEEPGTDWHSAFYDSLLTTETMIGILFGIIPSIILVISGILAMKFNENQKLNI